MAKTKKEKPEIEEIEDEDIDSIIEDLEEELSEDFEVVDSDDDDEEDEDDDEVEDDEDEVEDDDDLEVEDDDDSDEEEVDEVEEDEVDEEEDEDEDDPDEAPVARKRSRKGGKKVAKTEEDGVGTADIAEAAGISARSLRMLLRAEFPKEEGEGRYHWSSLNHPEVKKILKRIKDGAVKDQTKAKLDAVKGKKTTTAKRKKATAE